MKKTLFSIAAVLLGFLAHSQEAESLDRFAEVSVITRLDANPAYNSADSEFGFDLGNTSIYTLFEGSLSEHFSWTVANHWFHAESDGEYGWPYKYLGHSDSTNWLDYFKLDLGLGNWGLTLGKDMIATGGFEYEDWDWDIYPVFSSPLANSMSCYQWGSTLSYTTLSGMSNFSAQMTTSPFGEHPFSSGLWAYSAKWRGEYGAFSNIWSASALETAKGEYMYIFWLGQQVCLDSWIATLDLSNAYGSDEDFSSSALHGGTAALTVKYAPSDRFNASLRGSCVLSGDKETVPDHWTVGGIAEFYPLKESDDLRLHALLSYNSLLSQVTFSVGARYNLRLKVF